jgi:hypothetical protein
MTNNTLLLFTRLEFKFWGIMFSLLIIGLGYLANKLTRGNTNNYLNYRMNRNVKNILIFIQYFVSIVLALLLPNNYLNEIEFTKRLYEENELWIAGTILILLFSFIILFGTTFTLVSRLLGLKKLDY